MSDLQTNLPDGTPSRFCWNCQMECAATRAKCPKCGMAFACSDTIRELSARSQFRLSTLFVFMTLFAIALGLVAANPIVGIYMIGGILLVALYIVTRALSAARQKALLIKKPSRKITIALFISSTVTSLLVAGLIFSGFALVAFPFALIYAFISMFGGKGNPIILLAIIGAGTALGIFFFVRMQIDFWQRPKRPWKFLDPRAKRR